MNKSITKAEFRV